MYYKLALYIVSVPELAGACQSLGFFVYYQTVNKRDKANSNYWNYTTFSHKVYVLKVVFFQFFSYIDP